MSETEASSIGNVALRDAFWAYVKAGVPLIRERCQVSLEEDEQWADRGNGQYVYERRQVPRWFYCLEGLEHLLHGLPEYGELVRALSADPVVAPQLDTLVGTAKGASRVELSHVTNQVLERALVAASQGSFDEAWFDRAYSDLENQLHTERVEFEVIAPLYGFDGDGLPIVLGDGLAIVRMTSDQVIACLQANLLERHSGTLRLVWNLTPCAIRLTYSLPKLVGADALDNSTQQAEEVAGLVLRCDTQIKSVLDALRLFHAGRVTASGSVTRALTPLPGYAEVGGLEIRASSSRLWPNQYKLPAEKAAEFPDVWAAVGQARVQPAVDLAVRRFSDAGGRVSEEDRLLDLMIAAEALFGDEQHTEMTYKVALRAAVFIDVPGKSRLDTYRVVKKAYGDRSAIAHGGHRRRKKGVASSEELARFVERVSQTELLLRHALDKAVRQPQAWPPAWESILLGSVGTEPIAFK